MSSTYINTSKSGRTEPFQANKFIYLWSFATWLVVMNTTMFNVALPSVLRDLAITSATASWIVSGYSIVFAISTLTFGRLSDFIPMSKLLTIGISIIGIASTCGFFSNQFLLLLISRLFQASGAGAVAGLGMIVAGRYIPLPKRGKAMALIASGASLGFGLGPVLGGAITQYLGWNYLFCITLLLVLFIPSFHKLLPNETMEKGNFDLMGALITGLSVTALLFYLSTFSIFLLLGTIALFTIWWIHLNRIQEPFIKPDLLKNRQYRKLLSIGLIAFFANFSTLFLLPIILSSVFHKEPLEVGGIIFPGAILAVIAGQFIGRSIDRFGPVPPMIFGHLAIIFASIMFAFLSTKSPYFIMLAYLVFGIGFSSLNSSISYEVTRILPKLELAAGMGILQLTQFLGGSLGVTISGFLITMQESMPSEFIYRNIFFVHSTLVCIAILTFGLYIKKAKSIYSKGEVL